MTPLSDRVLIRCAKSETKSTGGVLLQAESSDKPNFGTVVAVGAGRAPEEGEKEAVRPNVAIGRRVCFLLSRCRGASALLLARQRSLPPLTPSLPLSRRPPQLRPYVPPPQYGHVQQVQWDGV